MRPRCQDHVSPIGFDEEDPEFEYHGESAHPDAVDGQCMCGHPDFQTCEATCTERDDTRECPRCGDLIALVDFRGNVCGDCADDLMKVV